MLRICIKLFIFLFISSYLFVGEGQELPVAKNNIQAAIVDADNNGLDDSWEARNSVTNPLGDEDNDGFINIIEFQEDLDPHVSNSDPSDQVNFRDLLVIMPGWNLVSVPDLATPTLVKDFIKDKCTPTAWLWNSKSGKYEPAENKFISAHVAYWFFATKYAAIPLERNTPIDHVSQLTYEAGAHGTQTTSTAHAAPTVTAEAGWRFIGWKFQRESGSNALKAVAQYSRVEAEPEPAAWMEGKWGFRFNMPGMKQPEALAQFDVQKMVQQIKVLDTATWVQINITQGANGSFYTSPHAELAAQISPDMVPTRDLFGEMLDALTAQGFKVMVYFATEGPTMGKHPDKALPGVIEKWKEYVKSLNMTPNEAVAEIIVKKYSLRYGSKISGWWFDHATFGDIGLLKKAALAGNPAALVTFNVGGSPKLLTCPESDFTAGHPTPVKQQLPSWSGNEVAIELIEQHKYIQGALGHFFPPMQEKWNSGNPVFETPQAIDWTMRVVKAGGAITWAVALANPKTHEAPLASFQFDQLKAINKAVKDHKLKTETITVP